MMSSTQTLRTTMKAVLAAAFFVPAAHAQPSAAADAKAQVQTVAQVCANVPAFEDEAIRPYLEMVLAPGKKINLAQIDPAVMAKLMTLQKDAIARQASDWPNLCRYAQSNAQVIASGSAPGTVLIGDSITEYWRFADATLFSDSWRNRGISGQTTAQMLLRFPGDVVALKPEVVHILAGTNDVAGNLGTVSDDTIVANITAMIDIARANRIKVVLGSIPPARFMSWKPGFTPAPRIVALNARLKRLAADRAITFVDYFSKLRDSSDGFAEALANDGVHPNRDGYAIMRPMLERAVKQASRKAK